MGDIHADDSARIARDVRRATSSSYCGTNHSFHLPPQEAVDFLVSVAAEHSLSIELLPNEMGVRMRDPAITHNTHWGIRYFFNRKVTLTP